MIRRAEARDLTELASLWRALLERHAALDPAFALRAGAHAALERALARLLADGDAALFVADEGGALAGYACVRVERAPALLAEPARAELTELAVRPERRRAGLGRALAGAARAWARGAGAARLEVRVAARNAEGQAFWRALGFEPFVDVLSQRL